MVEKDGGKGKGGMAGLAVVLLLLTLVGAGSGFAVGSLIQGEAQLPASEPEPAPKAAEKPDASHDSKDPAQSASGDSAPEAEMAAAVSDMKAVPFPPVLTTLAEPRGKWIRLEGSILTLKETEEPPELLAEKSGEQILGFLRTLKLEQIEGPSGLLALREDLNETVRVLSNEQVQGVLIHGLVVE